MPPFGTLLQRIGKRDLFTYLDQRQTKDADIEFMPYVQPWGLGLDRIKSPNNDTPIVVGTAVGRTSFYPGQSVVVATNTGRPGKVILGQPPPSQGGSSAYSVNSSLRDLPLAGDPSLDVYYAFFDGSGTITASIYNRDAFDHNVNTVGQTLNVGRTVPILHSVDGLVHDGSIAWGVDAGAGQCNGLIVWDATANAVFTYSCSGGRVFYAPGFALDKLWWIETTVEIFDGGPVNETGSLLHMHLMCASCDLSDVTEVSAHTIDASYPTCFPQIDLGSAITGLMITDTTIGARVEGTVFELGGFSFDVSFTLPGGVETGTLGPGFIDAGDTGTAPSTTGVISGGSVTPFALSGLFTRAAGINASVVSLWPFGGSNNCIAIPDGGLVSVYDGTNIYRAPLDAESSPVDTFMPVVHPTFLVPPTLMYAAT